MSTNIVHQDYSVNHQLRLEKLHNRPKVLWFTGLSGSGKSTLASNLEMMLFQAHYGTYTLDGDNIRSGLNKDLEFSELDRRENIRRIGEVARLFLDAGIIVLAAFVSPFREDRSNVREIIGKENFVEIFVKCSLEECEKRDVKGLYKKAREGRIPNFTGISSPFEEPKDADLTVDTEHHSLEECLEIIWIEIIKKIKK